jgi:hypothetical protein
MRVMHEPTQDELQRLRERAYGPAADILDDPAAMSRLHELEAQQTPYIADTSTLMASGAPAGPTGNDGNEAARAFAAFDEPRGHDDLEAGSRIEPTDAAPTPEETSDAAETSEDPEPSPAARRRRRILISAGALLLAALIGAAASYMIAQLHPGSVAILAPVPDAPWPENFGDRLPGAEVYQPYLGLDVYLVPQSWIGDETVPCLFVLSDASASAIASAGCGAGDFSPTAAVKVTSGMSAELRARHPAGSALQFVLTGGQVVVYADSP